MCAYTCMGYVCTEKKYHVWRLSPMQNLNVLKVCFISMWENMKATKLGYHIFYPTFLCLATLKPTSMLTFFVIYIELVA